MSGPVPERGPEYGGCWPVTGDKCRSVKGPPGQMAGGEEHGADFTAVQRGRRIGVIMSIRAAGSSWKAARQSQRQSTAASSERRTVPSQGRAGAGYLDVGGGLERFQVLADPQDHGQALVLQGPADPPLEGQGTVGRQAGRAWGVPSR